MRFLNCLGGREVLSLERLFDSNCRTPNAGKSTLLNVTKNDVAITSDAHTKGIWLGWC